MSALATAGAAAWVVPEILTAKPAAAAMSLPPETAPVSSGSVGTTGSGVTTAATTQSGPTSGVTTAPATQSGPTTAAATTGLAYSGLNIQRDVEIGAALVAGGWAMHHWASRTPKPAADGRIVGGSAGDPS